ncbi:MAG: ATP-binding protein [Acidobacteriota bacterium]|nr:ATP-binding protein [Acidobacteriota bacterium]
MNDVRRPRGTSLRSTLDRVLIHDIKNMGFRLELLLSNLEEHYDDPEFKQAVADLLRSTVDRLDGIVGRFSAHEDSVLIKVGLDLNEVVREAADQAVRRARRAAGGSTRLPVLSLSLGVLPEIWGDPFYLTDALTNLMANALEATPEVGKVVVRSFSEKTGRRPRALVEVIDNGAGMSPEFVGGRLFRAFETTKPDGVGLGLATANQIVRFHQGSMRVLSEPGVGTVVRLNFPGIIPAAPAAAAP